MIKKSIMLTVCALAVSVHSITFNIAVIEGKKVTFESKQYHIVKMGRELIRETKEKYSLKVIDRTEKENRIQDIFANMKQIGIYID